jgi:hypothetical protein
MLPNKPRKLSLHKETVRTLTHAEMAAIAGGARMALAAACSGGINCKPTTRK